MPCKQHFFLFEHAKLDNLWRPESLIIYIEGWRLICVCGGSGSVANISAMSPQSNYMTDLVWIRSFAAKVFKV